MKSSRGEYESILRQYVRKVEKYALRMNEDYEYFFRWHGDDMYKAQVNLKAIREMRPMTSWDDPDKIETWLGIPGSTSEVRFVLRRRIVSF